MRKCLLLIGLLVVMHMAAGNTITIPMRMAGVESLIEYYGPTGSTPDPTDPNQFRVSLTGNMLLIQTPVNAVSYVVIQENESEKKNEDYFYSISLGAVSCPITRLGVYAIRIGCWNVDYFGYLRVTKIALYDLNGHYLGASLDTVNELPAGYYIIRVETNVGTTSSKFYKKQ